jgi:hypothetical protein
VVSLAAFAGASFVVMTMKSYRLLKDRFEHGAGTIAFRYIGVDYGLCRDDERATGLEHIALTLDPNERSIPFFTVPVRDVEEIDRPGSDSPQKMTDDSRPGRARRTRGLIRDLPRYVALAVILPLVALAAGILFVIDRLRRPYNRIRAASDS